MQARSEETRRRIIAAGVELFDDVAHRRQHFRRGEGIGLQGVSVRGVAHDELGERIALDGVVISGHSAVNQAPITGESMPVDKSEGDTVFAGTINGSGSLEYRVTAEASHSTLARIIHAVEAAQGSRAPTQRWHWRSGPARAGAR